MRKLLIPPLTFAGVFGLGTVLNMILLPPDDHRGKAVVGGCVGIIAVLSYWIASLKVGFGRRRPADEAALRPGHKVVGYVTAAIFFAVKLAEAHGDRAGPWLDDLERELVSFRPEVLTTGTTPTPDAEAGFRQGIADIIELTRRRLAA